jgi:hypothetical protein
MVEQASKLRQEDYQPQVYNETLCQKPEGEERPNVIYLPYFHFDLNKFYKQCILIQFRKFENGLDIV